MDAFPLLQLLAVVAGGYTALLGVMYVFQRRLTYFPDNSPLPAPPWPEAEAVTLTTDDRLSLTAWWIPPPGKTAPLLLYFHGNAGNLADREEKLEAFIRAGFGVLGVSYRGYGGNDGTPTETGLYADARAALRFVQEKGYEQHRLVYYGESLGSGVAVQLASRYAPGLLVLEAPYTAVVDVGAERYPFIPVRLLMHDRFNSLERIGGIHCPLLLFHGERDAVVPVHFGKRLLDAANAPKQGIFLPHTGHTDFDASALAQEIAACWEQHSARQ